MPSLGETYERRAGAASRRQVLLGTGLFVSGALLIVGAILAGTTGLLITNGFSVYESREIAGILAGIGLPAVFVGITIVLPATRLHKSASVVGSGLAIFGVMLFRYAYPYRWYSGPGVPTNLVFVLTLVYVLGIVTTFWSLFTAIATFKTRNDPGGTVDLTVSKGGVSKAAKAVDAVQAEVQQAGKAISGIGGIGTFGGVDRPDRDVGPITATSDASVSDGGTTADDDIRPVEASKEAGPSRARASDEGVEVVGSNSTEPDQYCGNCTHFDYAEDGADMQPYCGLYDERMDDMQACEWWEQ
ncbi:MAG: hypothetical protein ABEJ58_01285 [Halodesulfurarchaeum sp.]